MSPRSREDPRRCGEPRCRAPDAGTAGWSTEHSARETRGRAPRRSQPGSRRGPRGTPAGSPSSRRAPPAAPDYRPRRPSVPSARCASRRLARPPPCVPHRAQSGQGRGSSYHLHHRRRLLPGSGSKALRGPKAAPAPERGTHLPAREPPAGAAGSAQPVLPNTPSP
ncbi:PREDICTED: protein VASP homolog [Chinchilla lanigera]|uniref:protein VASP homolog n=1 Tax=Chinchilla lanigera TaxID=34839 RepID=UPI000695F017|nr:PREDICTED: protein VASP homolog [Chinchilla lanigera]